MNEHIFCIMMYSCVPSLWCGDQTTRELTAIALLVVFGFSMTIGREYVRGGMKLYLALVISSVVLMAFGAELVRLLAALLLAVVALPAWKVARREAKAYWEQQRLKQAQIRLLQIRTTLTAPVNPRRTATSDRASRDLPATDQPAPMPHDAAAPAHRE